jgi:hypothetical protein
MFHFTTGIQLVLRRQFRAMAEGPVPAGRGSGMNLDTGAMQSTTRRSGPRADLLGEPGSDLRFSSRRVPVGTMETVTPSRTRDCDQPGRLLVVPLPPSGHANAVPNPGTASARSSECAHATSSNSRARTASTVVSSRLARYRNISR